MPHREDVPLPVAAIRNFAHDLPHQVDAESADACLVEPRRRRRGEVEGNAAIAEVHVYAAVPTGQPDAGGVLQACAAPMADRVHKQLFQHQVQLKFRLDVQRMSSTKLRNRDGQPLEFVDVTIQGQSEFFRNGTECATAAPSLSS